MTADQLFSMLNLLTLGAWLPLVFLPRVWWSATVLPVVAPSLLALIYVVVVAATFAQSEGGFSSLADVGALFENPWMLLAGWIHYLAFDLFVGGWEVRDAQRRGIRHLLIVPPLVLTFLFGPAGLLLYLVIRWFATEKRTGDRAICRPVHVKADCGVAAPTRCEKSRWPLVESASLGSRYPNRLQPHRAQRLRFR